MCGRAWIIVASLGLACGNDEDVGGSGDSQTTRPPDGTTTTGDTPTTGESGSDTDTESPTQTTADDTTSVAETTEKPPPDPLVVDCGDPPDGALLASYNHQPDVSGGNPGYTWAAEGLPAGLAINPVSGKITGSPEITGNFTFTLIVTDDDATVAETKCPDVTVNDKLYVDIDAFAGPCLGEGESLLQYITGGDGSEIVCATPKGEGDGDVPEGVSIDPATCEIVGAIEETRYGTWAWIVRARQSGADVFAPYCATQAQQAPSAYHIYGAHSGDVDNALSPLELFYNPDAPLKVDGDADPAFEVNKEVCGDSCFFGFFYKVSQSPLGDGACKLDADGCVGLCPLVPDAMEPDGDKEIGCSLLPKNMSPKTGFAHELWAKGDTPAAAFATRPFVQQWSIDYCISTIQADCSTKDGIIANGDGSNLEFAVILRPQP